MIENSSFWVGDKPAPTEPQADPNYKGSSDIKVVGVTFRPGYPDNLLQLAKRIDETGAPSIAATLEREPENEHDANAIKVNVGDQHIGYIPREVAEQFAPLMDKEGYTARAFLSVLISRKKSGDVGRKPGAVVFLDWYKQS